MHSRRVFKLLNGKHSVALAIIVVDVDDDLTQKAGIKGPIIGEEANLEAAKILALKDPEDTDANAIFKALKLYKERKAKGEDVVLATLTGDTSGGKKAYESITQQLEYLMKNYGVTSAIVVTDGEEDELTLPLISSRVKLLGVERLVMRQSRPLEQTYFAVISKLSDPRYAKVLLGVPGAILLFYAIVSYFTIPLPYIAFLLGSYLLLKGLGVLDRIEEGVNAVFGENLLRNYYFLFALSILVLLSVFYAYNKYVFAVSQGYALSVAYSYSLLSFIEVFGGVLVVFMFFRSVYFYLKGEMLRFYSSLELLINSASTLVLLWSFLRWYANVDSPYFSFDDFSALFILTVVVVLISEKLIGKFRVGYLRRTIKEGQDVYGEGNIYLGKAYKISGSDLYIVTPTGRSVPLSLKRVEAVLKEKIVVKGI